MAIELEPAVFDAVRRPQYLVTAFGRVYEMPGVTPVPAEADRLPKDPPSLST